jgi:hypothetical protein
VTVGRIADGASHSAFSSQWSSSMKRLLISGFVAVALLAIATTMRSYSISNERSTVTTGVALSKKSPASAGVTRLPIEEFDDMSLVFSTPPAKH